jgi:hypothetical protein
MQTELRLGPQNYAIGLSTDDSSRFQGFHSGHVLIVLDEAPGVRDEVYEAVEGIRAGGQVHVLALGNPTVAGGPFYDAFTTNRTSWRTFTINAFDTPNLQGWLVTCGDRSDNFRGQGRQPQQSSGRSGSRRARVQLSSPLTALDPPADPQTIDGLGRRLSKAPNRLAERVLDYLR